MDGCRLEITPTQVLSTLRQTYSVVVLLADVHFRATDTNLVFLMDSLVHCSCSVQTDQRLCSTGTLFPFHIFLHVTDIHSPRPQNESIIEQARGGKICVGKDDTCDDITRWYGCQLHLAY